MASVLCSGQRLIYRIRTDISMGNHFVALSTTKPNQISSLPYQHYVAGITVITMDKEIFRLESAIDFNRNSTRPTPFKTTYTRLDACIGYNLYDYYNRYNPRDPRPVSLFEEHFRLQGFIGMGITQAKNYSDVTTYKEELIPNMVVSLRPSLDLTWRLTMFIKTTLVGLYNPKYNFDMMDLNNRQFTGYMNNSIGVIYQPFMVNTRKCSIYR
jgi:hypothetical protein